MEDLSSQTCQINIVKSDPYLTLSNNKPQLYSLMLLLGTQNGIVDYAAADIALDGASVDLKEAETIE